MGKRLGVHYTQLKNPNKVRNVSINMVPRGRRVFKGVKRGSGDFLAGLFGLIFIIIPLTIYLFYVGWYLPFLVYGMLALFIWKTGLTIALVFLVVLLKTCGLF